MTWGSHISFTHTDDASEYFIYFLIQKASPQYFYLKGFYILFHKSAIKEE